MYSNKALKKIYVYIKRPPSKQNAANEEIKVTSF